MAKTTQYSFTNTTQMSTPPSAVALLTTTNYGLTAETPSASKYSNLTAATDSPEIISYRSRQLESKNLIEVQNPSKAPLVEYGVKLQSVLVTTDSNDSTYEVDDPVEVTITVTHPLTSRVTSDLAEVALKRAYSALYKADGTSKLGALMRSGLRQAAED